MTSNSFRAKIQENDTKVIEAICNALNALANPESHYGFIVTNDEKLVISVRRNKNSIPVFEVAFNASSLPNTSVSAINALFKKCIMSFGYDKSRSELVISIVDKYTYKPKVVETTSTENSEDVTCTLTLRKSIPMLEQVVEMLNIVKIQKFVTMSRECFSVLAIGDQIAFTLKLDALESHVNRVPFFFTKFNYLSAERLADYRFSVVKINANVLLQISVFVPDDPDRKSKFEKAMEMIESISIFSSQK